MKEAQEQVRKFNAEREWLKGDVKDLLLNVCEEATELWSVIKWVDKDKGLQLLKENTEEVEDFLGDTLYLVFKIAAMTSADAQKGFQAVMDEYETRFPIEKVKGSHANNRAGGHDGKYKK